MFHNWVKEYDQLELLRRQVSVTRQQLHLFSSYCSKPPLPSEIRRDLLNAHQMRAPHLAEEEIIGPSMDIPSWMKSCQRCW